MLRSLKQQNSDIGYNATKVVISQLASLCNAKVLQAEGADDLGSDLFAQFKDPTSSNDKFILGFQVKSGPSYVERHGNKGLKVKNLQKNYLKRISAFNIPIIIIWLDEKDNKAYYEFLARKHHQQFAYLSTSSYLAPFTIYDLMVKTKKVATTISSTYEVPQLSKLSAPLHIPLSNFAKSYYKKHLQKKEVVNPYIGHIAISNHCWRHITRNGRSIELIKKSLEALPFAILAIKSSKIIGYTGFKLVKRGNQEIALRTIKLQSDFKVNLDGQEKYIVLKIRERVIYPLNWRSVERIFEKISRELTLESIYFQE